MTCCSGLESKPCASGSCACGSPSTSSPAAGERSMDAKLDHWERHADIAFSWLLAFMEEHRDQILHVARARHITGHHVHGDKEMYEYSAGLLTKEILEEAADAVNYSVRRLTI